MEDLEEATTPSPPVESSLEQSAIQDLPQDPVPDHSQENINTLTTKTLPEQFNPHESTYNEQLTTTRLSILKSLLDPEKSSKSYTMNTKKESLVLEYVDNFLRQYTLLYPGRKDLLVAVPNEFGVKVGPHFFGRDWIEMMAL